MIISHIYRWEEESCISHAFEHKKQIPISCNSIRVHLHLYLVIIEWHNGASPFSQRSKSTHSPLIRDLLESAHKSRSRSFGLDSMSVASLGTTVTRPASPPLILIFLMRADVLLELNWCLCRFWEGLNFKLPPVNNAQHIYMQFVVYCYRIILLICWCIWN